MKCTDATCPTLLDELFRRFPTCITNLPKCVAKNVHKQTTFFLKGYV